MKVCEFIKFLQESYDPNEEICWQTWKREDFDYDHKITLEEWKIIVEYYSSYESDDRNVIVDLLLNLREDNIKKSTE